MVKRILIIDDHAVVRDGVKRIFEEQPGVTAFGEASTGPEAVNLVRQQPWDVAVLDLSLGGASGLEVLKELKQVRPKLPVLILSMHSEEQYARRAFRAGAAGYITKDSPRAVLVEAINRVVEGRRYVSSALAEKLATDLEQETSHAPHEALSDREFEVMCLIASGKTIRAAVTSSGHLISGCSRISACSRASIADSRTRRRNRRCSSARAAVSSRSTKTWPGSTTSPSRT